MYLNHKATGLAMSIPGALTLSGSLELILTVFSSAVLAKLIEFQRIQEQNIWCNRNVTGYFISGCSACCRKSKAPTSDGMPAVRRGLLVPAAGYNSAILWWAI